MRPHLIAFFERFMSHELASLFAPGWFTCVGLAGVVGLFLMMRNAKQHGIDPGVMASITLWCYLAAVSAGIIIPMLIEGTEQYLSHGRFVLRWAGMTSFWGYLAGISAVVVVCKRNAVPLAQLGDLAAVPMGVALVFSRLGCFLGGCDYGKVTSVPWALRFPQGSPAWVDHVNGGLVPAGRGESLPVHPTQLYESLLGLVIVGVVLLVARTAWAKRRQGRLFLAACATYAIGRIVIEMFRADLGRGIYLGFSSGQIFSICTLLVVASGLLLTRRRVIATLSTAGVVLALVVAPRAAVAQPNDPYAPPTQPADPGEQPTQPTQPAQPTQPPTAQPPVVYEQVPQDPAIQAPRDIWGTRNSIGLLLGAATSLNRRDSQVKALTGISLSVGFMFQPMFGLNVDFDSFGNADATHGTLLVTGSIMTYPNGRLRYGGRAGFGATLVNFHDPVFRDVTGATLRAEGVIEYDLTPKWELWLRPLTLDYLTAKDLGGPILSWQIRAGIAWKWGSRGRPAPPPPSPQFAPYSPPPVTPPPADPSPQLPPDEPALPLVPQ